MKLAVAILISGSGTNMVQLIKSMDGNHPAYPSVVISNNSDAPAGASELFEITTLGYAG